MLYLCGTCRQDLVHFWPSPATLFDCFCVVWNEHHTDVGDGERGGVRKMTLLSKWSEREEEG